MIEATLLIGVVFLAGCWHATRGRRGHENAKQQALRGQAAIDRLLARTGLYAYLSDIEAFGTHEEGIHEFRLHVHPEKRQALAQSDIDLDAIAVPEFPDAKVRLVWFGGPEPSHDFEVERVRPREYE